VNTTFALVSRFLLLALQFVPYGKSRTTIRHLLSNSVILNSSFSGFDSGHHLAPKGVSGLAAPNFTKIATLYLPVG